MTPALSSMMTLRRFVQRPAPIERCDLCKTTLAPDHAHLLDAKSRRLLCSCTACAILFSDGDAKYRRVTSRVQYLPGFRMTDGQWESLHIPIGVAFLFQNTAAESMVAVYPSPVGATESQLPQESWQLLAECDPALADLKPDVEALLVNRLGGARDHYLVSVDQCYRLVGLVRAHWTGFSGGAEVRAALGRFFAELKEQSHA